VLLIVTRRKDTLFPATMQEKDQKIPPPKARHHKNRVTQVFLITHKKVVPLQPFSYKMDRK
jgi:hypothetical protein